MKRWNPTHRILFDEYGSLDVMVVASDEGGHIAYTRSEWESCSSADYEVMPNGDWLFQGRPSAASIREIETGERTHRRRAYRAGRNGAS